MDKKEREEEKIAASAEWNFLGVVIPSRYSSLFLSLSLSLSFSLLSRYRRNRIWI